MITRLAVIIGVLPQNIQNGQTADAIPLMQDLNFIVNQVNANAAPLANTALLNAANSFTAVQSGLAATSPANFPIASQVQNFSFNTLSSVLGTNTISARIAALPLGALVSGQIFTFIPSQPNTGAVGVTIDGLGSTALTKFGRAPLVLGDLLTSQVAVARYDGSVLQLLGGPLVGQNLTSAVFSGTITGLATLGSNVSVPGQRLSITTFFSALGGDVALNNTGTFFDGPSVSQGNSGTWLAIGTVTMSDSVGAARFNVRLWDGVNVAASCAQTSSAAGFVVSATISGIIANPQGNIRISVQDVTSTNGSIRNNVSGDLLDSHLRVYRIG